jgi:hypothetical protein
MLESKGHWQLPVLVQLWFDVYAWMGSEMSKPVDEWQAWCVNAMIVA